MHDPDGKLLALIMGGVIHDSNNLSAIIGGHTELAEHLMEGLINVHPELANEKEVEQMRKFLAIATYGANALNRSNKSVLELCRRYYSAEKRVTETADIQDIATECRRIINAIGPDWRIGFRGIANLAPLPCPPPVISTVFRELMYNTIKANPDKLAKLHILVSIKYSPADYILIIKYYDNGGGFAHGEIDRLHLSDTRFGLYFISEMARRLNGWFHASNRKNGGAEISLALVINP